MDFIEEEVITIAILLLKKYKIEKKLRQTFRCFLRRLFSCCGMKNIENELKHLNESIEELKKVNREKSGNTEMVSHKHVPSPKGNETVSRIKRYTSI